MSDLIQKLRFSIVRNYKIFFGITITFLCIGFGSMIMRGFNLGIDFTGGTIMDLYFQRPVKVVELREVMSSQGLGNSIIQLANSDGESSPDVLIRTGIITEAKRREVVEALKAKFGEYEIQRIEQVDATVGGELIEQAVTAIVLSWVLMIAYISLRFEFRFAIAAILALIVDVSVTLSYFSLLQIELDSSFVAALLTVVGYSINSTIVVFDRIRENMKLRRRTETLSDMIDNSIWQTMTRTFYTSLTSLFSVVAIFLWGGETIRNFSFAMLVGFSSGIYTSSLLAAPMWLFLRGKKAGD
ncbi:MAG: protein translocase subunit SecF [Acidaminococcaceae bacterium]|nr:protein translocase subunit SecF [Acidaminococcaceae bacterium]